MAGDLGTGIDLPTLDQIASDVAEAFKSGIQMGIVIGGGNIFRGVRLLTDSYSLPLLNILSGERPQTLCVQPPLVNI